MGYPQQGYMGDALGLSWNIAGTLSKIVSGITGTANKVNTIAQQVEAAAQKAQVGVGAVKGAVVGAQTGATAGGATVMAQQSAGPLLKNPAVLIGGGALALLAVTTLARRR